MDFLMQTLAPTPLLSSTQVKAKDTRQFLEEMVPNSGALETLVTQVSNLKLAGQPADELAPLSRFPEIYQEARSLQHARQGRPIRSGFRSASPLDRQREQLTAAPIRPSPSVPSFSTAEEEDRGLVPEDKGEAWPSSSIVKTKKVAKKRRAQSKSWSQEECNHLRQLVAKYPKGVHARWRHISQELATGRTPDQCSQKWLRVLDPSIKKGDPWTAQEDEVIVKYISACKEAGARPSWARLASMLPGRTDTNIRYRYVEELCAVDDNYHNVVT
ncbi:Myb-like DNA-binding domain [Carpediemonas membranifera]|uniref:Myb-like DNA-binding domain n=1 Tax=Carpediemonas membranifera TaxID=201153 RepID=A0A8J6B3A3_9EUKA|nr:Myb-like DNA-binding domain [Carpediemonas membranifera]|eukprot:KAG9392057.1 Myb-like DNA-binding domain [Carpediemonas membranifera]